MNFFIKLIAVCVLVFFTVSFVAYKAEKKNVGEVTLNDVGKTARKGADDIRKYLVEKSASERAEEVLDDAKNKVKEVVND